MDQLPDNKPANYYVSVQNDAGDYRLLVGPFKDDHAKALALVQDAISAAYASGDPNAPWYSYGTLCTEYSYDKPGILNDKVLT